MQCEKCGKKVFANETCECGQKAPKKNNGGVRANTIICFILLMITTLCLILTLSFRTVVNKNLLVKSVEKVELAEIEVEDGKKLDQYIYDEYIADERITVENVDNLLKDPFIKDFLTEKINAYQNFALDDGELPYITSDDIVKLIDDNQELLFNEAGLRFLEPDKAELKDDLSALDDFEKFSRETLDTTFMTKLVQTFFSYANVIFLIVLMAVILIQWFIVYKVNARRGAKVLINYGIAVMIPSLLVLTGVLVFTFAPDMDIADKIFSSAKTPFYVLSLIFIVLGGLIMAAGLPFIKKKNAEETSVEEMTEISDEPETAENDSQEKKVIQNICPQCSFANKETASFCSRCGTNLKTVEKNKDPEIKPVLSEEEILSLESLAKEIWNQHFVPIIGQEQVDYMLEKFQSSEAIKRQISEGMHYFMVQADGENAGYCAYKIDGNRVFLSKLYVKLEYRGNGLGKLMLENIRQFASENDLKAVYLTVNKHNDDTISIYHHLGFQVIDSVVSDIGGGFVMDDFIMQLTY